MAAQYRATRDAANIRFPPGLRDRLQEEAQRLSRSMNAEIVARLEASFEHGAGSLDGEIGEVIKRHIEAEVHRRLRDIASKIGEPA